MMDKKQTSAVGRRVPTEVELNRSLMLCGVLIFTMYIFALCAHARLRRARLQKATPCALLHGLSGE